MFIFGASGHGKVILDIINTEGIHKVEGFWDDNPCSDTFCKLPLVKPDYTSNNKLVIAIGDNQIRKKISEKFKNYITSRHPFSWVSNNVSIGEGSIIMSGVSINRDCSIGKHCIINTNSSIDHDCLVEDFVHISPNVALAGGVTIGEGTHIGIGASIIQSIKIGKNVTIGAGATIINNIPDNTVVVGTPGKIIKYKNL